MFDVVLPSLAQKDEERKEEIEQALVAIQNATKESKKDKAEDLIDVLRLLRDSIPKLNRADQMFRTNSIACIIARFDEYIAQLLRIYFHANPEQFISSEKSLTYQDVQGLTSIGQVLDTFIDKEVGRLLRDSHVDQVKFLDERLKLGVQDHFSLWCDFVEVTERRNLFTHSGGVVTPQYLRVCKSHNCALPKDIAKGVTLDVDTEYFNNSHTCFYQMAFWLGQSSVRRLFPKKLEAADTALINGIGFPLLLREQWEFAEKVFSFGMSLPEKLVSNERSRKLFAINQAIALRHMGKEDASIELLDLFDWSSSHLRFVLPVSILKNAYDKAGQIMGEMGTKKPFSEKEYRTWPIFKNFRHTPQFAKAFKEIYNKNYKPEVSAQTLPKAKTRTVPTKKKMR